VASDRTVVIVLAACALMLVGGFLLKGQCLLATAFEAGHQYSRLCYNDIQPLYGIRSVAENVFPYIGGEFTVDHQLIGGAVEYPVLTGLFLWFAGLFASDANGYLRMSAILLAPFGLLTAYLLARMTGWRALMFAASPAVVFYAFHNWDLLVVAAVVAGMWFWWKDRPVWAAVMFGVGAALKLYPILFVIPLVVEHWMGGRRSDAGKIALAGGGTALGINLPFMLINFSGWWATYEFHRVRGPNYDSIWGLAASRWGWSLLQMPSLNMTVAVVTVGTFAIALIYGWQKGRERGSYPFLQVAAALLVAFLLWNKVHSPQYTLWLLPFFVLLRVHVLWWVAYAAIDTLAYVSIFRWFFDYVYEGEGIATPAYRGMVYAVWVRALLLLALLVVFLRARSATDPEPDANAERFPSHPPASLDPVGADA
jgi:uncharacterized membrane protein